MGFQPKYIVFASIKENGSFCENFTPYLTCLVGNFALNYLNVALKYLKFALKYYKFALTYCNVAL